MMDDAGPIKRDNTVILSSGDGGKNAREKTKEILKEASDFREKVDAGKVGIEEVFTLTIDGNPMKGDYYDETRNQHEIVDIAISSREEADKFVNNKMVQSRDGGTILSYKPTVVFHEIADAMSFHIMSMFNGSIGTPDYAERKDEGTTLTLVDRKTGKKKVIDNILCFDEVKGSHGKKFYYNCKMENGGISCSVPLSIYDYKFILD